MEQQTYPVACECGKVQDVTGGKAGSSFACPCGKLVEVPTLGTLKRSVGLSAVSADLEIRHRLAERSLPIESDCVLCKLRTDDTLRVTVVCEQSEEKSSFKWWYWVFFPIGFWFLLLLVFAYFTRRDERLGRDVSFTLPTRVCHRCAPQVRTAVDAADVLRQTVLYARLLDKYPHATVTPNI